jgi:hypothetical protein
MVPGISSIGVLANPDVSYLPFEEDTKQAAQLLGLALVGASGSGAKPQIRTKSTRS